MHLDSKMMHLSLFLEDYTVAMIQGKNSGGKGSMEGKIPEPKELSHEKYKIKKKRKREKPTQEKNLN